MNKETIKQLISDEIEKCVRCGACRHLCPVFNAENTEESSPRGKNSLLLHLLEGDYKSSEIKTILNSCTLCEACIQGCPNKVHTYRIVLYGRILSAENKLEETAFSLFNQNDLLALGQKTLSRFQKLFFQREGDLQSLRWRMGNLNKYISKIPDKNFFDLYQELPDQTSYNKKVLFFVGCLIRYLYPETGIHLVEILNKFGWGVIVPEEQVCCGLPAISNGYLEPFLQSMKKNIGIFNNYNKIQYILSACGSCGNTLQNLYPEFNEIAAISEEETRLFTHRIMDVSYFFTNILKLDTITNGTGKEKVTYHDSCHLARGMKITEAPRSLIRKNATFIELPESDVCCGFGGSFSVKEAEVSHNILKRKIENVKSTEAEYLLAGCPGCVLQLKEGTYLYSNGEIKVKHLIDFLYEKLILTSG